MIKNYKLKNGKGFKSLLIFKFISCIRNEDWYIRTGDMHLLFQAFRHLILQVMLASKYF